MTTIIGVDFSGARADTNTWMTRGELMSDGSLALVSAQRTRRDDLYQALLAVMTPAVAALDFPFGVPAHFADHITRGHPAYEMSTLWDAVGRMSPDEFIAARETPSFLSTASPSVPATRNTIVKVTPPSTM